MIFPYRRRTIPTQPIIPSWHLAWEGDAPHQPDALVVAGAVPELSPGGRFAVVGDIWLTNERSLLQRLGMKTAANSWQLVAQLWERWGRDCMGMLEGAFALAVWDREEGKLWLGRDRVGARTLYYTTTGSVQRVAPRLSTLNPYHSKELDIIALRDYLSCAFVPGERTMWEQVRELPPGTLMCLGVDKEPQPYWRLQVDRENINLSLAQHAAQLRLLLEQIVTESLPVDEPIGAYLSGGLDSSCVTAIAAQLHRQPIHTYSIHFGPDCPHELEFSSLVASHCHTQHHIIEITPQQMWELLPITMANLDDPIGDPLTVPNYIMGQIARQSVNVIFNGEGGDPCFAGPKNKPMLLDALYSQITTEAPSPAQKVEAYLNSFQKCFADLPQLLQPDIWAAVQKQPSVFAPYLTATDTSYLNRLMLLNIRYKGADQILTKVNNMTRAAMLEARSPLFDQRIVELSLQIPPQYKLAGADEKAVLKQAVADLLPEAILTRPKSGMMVPVNLWFAREWQRRARSLLLNKKAAIAPYLDQKVIKNWLEYRGDTWRRYGVKLWLLTSLEIWLQVN
ncbi:MAG: asparagine synthase (glutamine-hydrolyzing) [Oscillatoriaceae cyanobacterium]